MKIVTHKRIFRK